MALSETVGREWHLNQKMNN